VKAPPFAGIGKSARGAGGKTMSFMDKTGGVSGFSNVAEEPEKVDEAIRDFRLERFMPGARRPAAGLGRWLPPGARRIWRLATGWALAAFWWPAALRRGFGSITSR